MSKFLIMMAKETGVWSLSLTKEQLQLVINIDRKVDQIIQGGDVRDQRSQSIFDIEMR